MAAELLARACGVLLCSNEKTEVAEIHNRGLVESFIAGGECPVDRPDLGAPAALLLRLLTIGYKCCRHRRASTERGVAAQPSTRR